MRTAEKTALAVRPRLPAIWLAFCAVVAAASIQPAWAEAGKDLLICKFKSDTNAAPWQAGAAGTTVKIEPRTPQDVDYKLKVTTIGGEYPGISLPAPPRDWSAYDCFKFELWSEADTRIELRIDDRKSDSYSTRFNFAFTVTKGRNLVQIPIAQIRKAIDVSQIKLVNIFMDRSSPGFTLYYDSFRLGPKEKEEVAFIPYSERKDLQPTLDVRTPHFPFGRNLASGPLKVFAVNSVTEGRAASELMERLDLQPSIVTWDREWDANTWGLAAFYGERGHRDDCILVQKYLDSSLQGPEKFDAMVMTTPWGWSFFPQGAKDCILRRVERDGEGLVLIMPFPGGAKPEWTDELRKVCALVDAPSDFLGGGYSPMTAARSGILRGKKWRAVGSHPITDGVPLDALPFTAMDVMQCRPAEGAQVLIETEDGNPVLAVKQLGKGRVATFFVRADSLTPPMSVSPAERLGSYPQRYWEIWYDLLARTICWSAGRTFEKNGEPSELAVQGEDADEYLKVRQWKDGRGKVTDWQIEFTPPSPKKSIVLLSAPEMVEPGADIEVTFAPPKGLEKASGLLTAAEPSIAGSERIVESMDVNFAETYLPQEGRCRVRVPTARLSRTSARLRLFVPVDGKIMAEGRTVVLLDPSQTWEDFEIHCWGGNGVPYLADVEKRLMRQLGVTCQQTGSPAEMKDALADGFRIQYYAGIEGLHLTDLAGIERAYQRTKDRSLLVRKPSFADPEELARRHKAILDRLGPIAKYKPLSGILADETSLTSYSAAFDFDFHPANIEAFRRKLEARFGTVQAMNKALKTTWTSFADLMPPTTPEAKEGGNWGLWNEWRSHNDDMWSGVFLAYSKWFAEVAPGIRLSVSGTQVSSPFNGIDWAKMTPALRSVAGYHGRYQEVQRINFHPTGDLKTLSWVGYANKGLAVKHQMWSNLFEGDAGCGIFWWYSMRNPDLTWCQSAKDYMTALDVLRRGLGRQYQLSSWLFTPTAVLWSPNSQRAAYALGRYDEFVKTEAEVVESLRKAGFDPYFISEPQLLAGELKTRGARALFLPMTLSLGMGAQPAGIKIWPAVKEFLDQKGVVVTTCAPERDEFLQPLTPPPELAGRAVSFSSLRSDLRGELARRGIKPWVTVKAKDGSPMDTVRVYVHQLRSGETPRGCMLGFLLPPARARNTVGSDGVSHVAGADVAGAPVSCVADCSELQFAAAYDQKSGKRIEMAGRAASLELTPAQGEILTLLPYGVKAIAADLKTENRTLAVGWRIVREEEGGGDFAPHVVRIEVADAETGEPNADLCRNAASGPDGKGSIRIPLSLADAQRKWNVMVKDVLTGFQGAAVQQ